MGTADKIRKWIIDRFIHPMMEWAQNDPDVSYDDWKTLLKNYRDSVGKDYRAK